MLAKPQRAAYTKNPDLRAERRTRSAGLRSEPRRESPRFARLGVYAALIFSGFFMGSFAQFRVEPVDASVDIGSRPHPLAEPDGAQVLAEPVRGSRSQSDTEAVLAYIRTVNPKLRPSDAAAVAKALVRYSAEYKVPLDLAVGVAHAESHFRPDARGTKTQSGSASGPMQVMYGVHRHLLAKHGIRSEAEARTADKGIRAGCLLLGRYIEDRGSVSAGLGKYLSSMSPDYILGKVLSSSITFSFFREGIIDAESVKERIASERSAFFRMIRRR